MLEFRLSLGISCCHFKRINASNDFSKPFRIWIWVSSQEYFVEKFTHIVKRVKYENGSILDNFTLETHFAHLPMNVYASHFFSLSSTQLSLLVQAWTKCTINLCVKIWWIFFFSSDPNPYPWFDVRPDVNAITTNWLRIRCGKWNCLKL